MDGVYLVQDISLQVPDDEFSFIVAARNELARRTDAHPDSVRLVVRRETHGHAEVSQASIRLLPHLVDLPSGLGRVTSNIDCWSFVSPRRNYELLSGRRMLYSLDSTG